MGYFCYNTISNKNSKSGRAKAPLGGSQRRRYKRGTMQLRNLQIPAGAVFAPMAGLTDAACRHLMADHGAAWTVSEMASAKALNFNDQKSFALLKDAHPHGLYAIQLFGCEPEALEKAILLVREKGIRFDILDINMGCPAPKITNSGAGSKLLLDPPLCGRMVAAARRALGEDTPLTVKMRIGWDAEHLTGVEVAKQCEANGADLIAVHGRTREQMYVPPIDAGAIAAIKQAVSIPVLANGDITTAEGALTLLKETGCDGVMIGRGALGDPWLFEQIRAALLGANLRNVRGKRRVARHASGPQPGHALYEGPAGCSFPAALLLHAGAFHRCGQAHRCGVSAAGVIKTFLSSAHPDSAYSTAASG